MDTTVDSVLAHYGVKGMRWGTRRNKDGSTSKTGKRAKSEDHEAKTTLQKKRVSEMSNVELRKVNERMQLEQTYSQLMRKQGTAVTRGNKYIKDALGLAKTGQELYNVANSPAGKALREVVELAIKR